MSQKFHRSDSKNTFGRIDDQPVLIEEVEDVTEVADMGGPVPAEDEDVVEVDEDEGYTTKNPVHHPLERLGRIPETKWHFQKFKKAKRGHDRRLEDVLGGHGNLILSFY